MFQLIVFAAIITTFASGNPANKIQTRVLNGHSAGEGQFPYQVSLQSNGRHFCGGSIIAKNIIITAAHCVVEQMPYLLTVKAGTVHLYSGGVTAGVKYYISHPFYNPQTMDNDLAIIYLANYLIEDPNIQPIKLVEPSDSVKPGDSVTLSGWGQNSLDFFNGFYIVRGSSPENLQYAKIPIWERNMCIQALGYMVPITPRMFCAGRDKGQVTSCPGDSGGPLVKDGKLVGVVSWGIGCGKNAPAVYTKVAELRSWIYQNTGI